MRTIIALLVIIYLVGVGVMLAPTIEGGWNTVTAAELLARIVQELPRAMAWPSVLYHSIVNAPAEKA